MFNKSQCNLFGRHVREWVIRNNTHMWTVKKNVPYCLLSSLLKTAIYQCRQAFYSHNENIHQSARHKYNLSAHGLGCKPITTRCNKETEKWKLRNKSSTYVPRSSNFSSTAGALKLRTNSVNSATSRFNRKPPLHKHRSKVRLQSLENWTKTRVPKKTLQNRNCMQRSPDFSLQISMGRRARAQSAHISEHYNEGISKPTNLTLKVKRSQCIKRVLYKWFPCKNPLQF
jgi:hypothetical protein